ncbi:hypothetical protein M0811_01451 [Anaeramoeba ignava]|uniref:Uncharacterized protein n=1 Tax=Anaeramoeba ignava TaxID=1746090 RepID=A0A9Q0LGU1_ANAIG|nr:hypothetical protein M0811_01451 [Anaeramoeba ignava]
MILHQKKISTFLSQKYKDILPQHLKNIKTNQLKYFPKYFSLKTTIKNLNKSKEELKMEKKLAQEISQFLLKLMRNFFTDLNKISTKKKIEEVLNIISYLNIKNPDQNSLEFFGQNLLINFLQMNLPPITHKFYLYLQKQGIAVVQNLFSLLIDGQMSLHILILLESDQYANGDDNIFLKNFPQITPNILSLFEGDQSRRFFTIISKSYNYDLQFMQIAKPLLNQTQLTKKIVKKYRHLKKKNKNGSDSYQILKKTFRSVDLGFGTSNQNKDEKSNEKTNEKTNENFKIDDYFLFSQAFNQSKSNSNIKISLEIRKIRVLMIVSENGEQNKDNVVETLTSQNNIEPTVINASKKWDLNQEILNSFHCVFVYSSQKFYHSKSLGNILANYVENGGSLIISCFAINKDSFGLKGKIISDQFFPVKLGKSLNTKNNIEVGKIYSENHPILNGVSRFNCGNQNVRTDIVALQNSNVIAEWNDGIPLIIEKNYPNSGLIVVLNFYPVSSKLQDGYWNFSSDGGLILRNAIKFCSTYF